MVGAQVKLLPQRLGLPRGQVGPQLGVEQGEHVGLEVDEVADAAISAQDGLEGGGIDEVLEEVGGAGRVHGGHGPAPLGARAEPVHLRWWQGGGPMGVGASLSVLHLKKNHWVAFHKKIRKINPVIINYYEHVSNFVRKIERKKKTKRKRRIGDRE